MMRSAILALSLVWGLGAQAGTFSYVVKHVPQDEGDCHERARRLGADVQAATGVVVERAICTAVDGYGANLLVEYAADTELEVVTTVASRPGVDTGGGIFASLADCRAALPGELARFKAATRLDPVISFCTVDPFGDEPYAIKIDAFGAAVAAPQVGDWRFFGSPVGATGAQIAAAVRDGLVARGIDPSYVSYKEAASDGILVAGYYAVEGAASRDLDVAFTDTEGQCLAAVDDARTVFQGRSDSGVLTTVCSFDQYLERYNVTTLAIGADALSVAPAVERFGSYAACSAAKAELTRKYRDELHRPVIGAVCGKAREEEWAVVFYEQI